MEIGIHFGCMADPLETQCNSQGFTLGKHAEEFQEFNDHIISLWLSGILNDREKENACNKLFTRIKRAVRIKR